MKATGSPARGGECPQPGDKGGGGRNFLPAQHLIMIPGQAAALVEVRPSAVTRRRAGRLRGAWPSAEAEAGRQVIRRVELRHVFGHDDSRADQLTPCRRQAA
jgi:hypothetical protein